MNQPVISIASSVSGRFGLRLGLWLSVYALILVAWGERNQWPHELLIPMLSLPATLLVGRQLYRRNGIGLHTRLEVPQWELLISFLFLAIGMASGLVLLLALGWLSIGVTWLRPTQANVSWTEWFKLPLLFLLSLPILSDLAGSPHDLLRSMAVHDGMENPQGYLAAQFLLRAVLLVLALRFVGAAFWLGLAAVASAGIFHQVAGKFLSSSVLPWATGIVAGAMAITAWSITLRMPRLGQEIWRELSNHLLSQSQSPWLAGLVIALQQSALLERWSAVGQSRFVILGLAVLLASLFILRSRNPSGRVHVFSQILLAGALFVLLGAEWTDLNFFRQISLGMLLVSVLSWQRAWSLWVLGSALFCWMIALPAVPVVLQRGGLDGEPATMARNTLLFAGLASLIWAAVFRSQTKSLQLYSDYGWLPVKRFAGILLMLLTGFQIASVYWPGEGSPAAPQSGFIPMLTSSRTLIFFRANFANHRALHYEQREIDFFTVRLREEPIRLQSPELILTGAGWSITERHLVAHANGQIVAMHLERNGRRAAALGWYQFGDITFTHYLRARNILWSGWNLNRRDLRLNLLLAEGASDSSSLVKLAESEHWFIAPPMTKTIAPSNRSGQ